MRLRNIGALTLAIAPVIFSASVAIADSTPIDDFTSALEREDFDRASRATFGPLEFESKESEHLHELQVAFYAEVLELFVRELGGILEKESLAEKPDDVDWLSMVREVDNEDADSLSSKSRTYRVNFAYEGTGFIHLIALPYRVREFGFGLPDSGPESARRHADLMAKLAQIQPRRPPGTRTDARRITSP